MRLETIGKICTDINDDPPVSITDLDENTTERTEAPLSTILHIWDQKELEPGHGYPRQDPLLNKTTQGRTDQNFLPEFIAARAQDPTC